MTPADLLAAALRRDPARPLLTWYGDATGARVELSVATAANWAAKIAGWLTEECELEPGAVVGVPLTPHWQSAVVLLGAWTAGGGVADDATVVLADAAADPMGAGLARAVAAHPDVFVPVLPVDPGAPALRLAGREWTHESLAAAAAAAVRGHGLEPGCRVLSTLDYATATGVDAGLLVPLAAAGSVVLVADADQARLAERCEVERVTHTAGVTVGGLPRLDD